MENKMKNYCFTEKSTEEINDQNIEFVNAEHLFKESVKLENRFYVDVQLKCPIEQLNIVI